MKSEASGAGGGALFSGLCGQEIFKNLIEGLAGAHRLRYFSGFGAVVAADIENFVAGRIDFGKNGVVLFREFRCKGL